MVDIKGKTQSEYTLVADTIQNSQICRPLTATLVVMPQNLNNGPRPN